jgi:Protein of unknown function (DUF5818)
MRRLVYLGLTLFMAVGLSAAAPRTAAKGKIFMGSISDKMCGAKHMMGDAKQCTLECVKAGSKFVLVSEDGKTIYDLSDQKKPETFAGARVKVTGTLKGGTIEVSSIEAAK